MAKAAVHQLVKSLAAPGSGLPDGARAMAILPYVLFSVFSLILFVLFFG